MTEFKEQEQAFAALVRVFARQALRKEPSAEVTHEMLMATVCLGLADVCQELSEFKRHKK